MKMVMMMVMACFILSRIVLWRVVSWWVVSHRICCGVASVHIKRSVYVGLIVAWAHLNISLVIVLSLLSLQFFLVDFFATLIPVFCSLQDMSMLQFINSLSLQPLTLVFVHVSLINFISSNISWHLSWVNVLSPLILLVLWIIAGGSTILLVARSIVALSVWIHQLLMMQLIKLLEYKLL